MVGDFDGDGRPDIYVANDTTMNFFSENLGGGRFEDVSIDLGRGADLRGAALGGMGVNAGDLDGDGQIDIVVANFEAELNSFFRNVGEGVFEDVSAVSGFGGPSGTSSPGFGLSLLDAANAGRLDAFIANGHVLERPAMDGLDVCRAPVPDVERRQGQFHEQGCGEPFRRALVGRGSAAADFDNDGDMDIAVSNSGGPLQLLRNDGKHGDWIGFVSRGRNRTGRESGRGSLSRRRRAGRCARSGPARAISPRAIRARTSESGRPWRSSASSFGGLPASFKRLATRSRADTTLSRSLLAR